MPVAADGSGELVESETTDDGDDCQCDGLPDDVPCFNCYRDGATFG